jgi:hypothetical protein
MSISVQRILENHELRLRDLEGRQLPENYKSFIQNNNKNEERDETIAKLESIVTESKQTIFNMNEFVRQLSSQVADVEKSNNELLKLNNVLKEQHSEVMNKYHNLAELHCLMMKDFLQFKEESGFLKPKHVACELYNEHVELTTNGLKMPTLEKNLNINVSELINSGVEKYTDYKENITLIIDENENINKDSEETQDNTGDATEQTESQETQYNTEDTVEETESQEIQDNAEDTVEATESEEIQDNTGDATEQTEEQEIQDNAEDTVEATESEEIQDNTGDATEQTGEQTEEQTESEDTQDNTGDATEQTGEEVTQNLKEQSVKEKKQNNKKGKRGRKGKRTMRFN